MAEELVTQVSQNAPLPVVKRRVSLSGSLEFEDAKYPSFALLPPQSATLEGKKTLVLDMDETLIHSSFKPIPDPDFILNIEIDDEIHKVYVLKRPGVDNFLRQVAKKFEVVVFTASLSKYADPLLDKLDVSHSVHHRLFREHCVKYYGNYVKDLSKLGRELKNSVIVDNSPYSYIFHPEHAIPVTSWFSDPADNELELMLPILEHLASSDDVTKVLSEYFLIE